MIALVLTITAGLAFVAGLAVGLVVLVEYLDRCPSPADHERANVALRTLEAAQQIAAVEADTQRRMFEAAIEARRARQDGA